MSDKTETITACESCGWVGKHQRSCPTTGQYRFRGYPVCRYCGCAMGPVEDPHEDVCPSNYGAPCVSEGRAEIGGVR